VTFKIKWRLSRPLVCSGWVWDEVFVNYVGEDLIVLGGVTYPVMIVFLDYLADSKMYCWNLLVFTINLKLIERVVH
jgi:hypothetical protein